MTTVEIYRNRQILVTYHTDLTDRQQIEQQANRDYKGIWTDIKVTFLIKNK